MLARGREKDLELSVRHHDGSDIPANHHDTLEGFDSSRLLGAMDDFAGIPALLVHQGATHAGVTRHQGDIPVYLSIMQLRAHTAPGNFNRIAVLRDGTHLCCCRKISQTVGIVGCYALLRCHPGDRPVHEAGVEEPEAQAVC